MTIVKGLSVTLKVLMAFGVMLAVALIGFGVTYKETFNVSALVNTNTALNTAGRAIEAIKVNAEETRAGVTGFLLTGNRDYVALVDDLVERRSALFGNARAVLDAEFVQALSSIEGALAHWYDEHAARQINLMRDPMTVDMARALETTGVPAADYAAAMAMITELGSAINAEMEASAIAQDESLAAMERVVMIAGLMMVVFTGCFAYLAYRVLSRPVREIAATTETMAGGNLDVEIGFTQRGDEIGDVARALAVFRENLSEARRIEEEAKRRDEEQRKERHHEMQALADDFEATVREIVTDVSTAAKGLTEDAASLAAVSEQTRNQVDTVLTAAEQSAASVSTVAGASEELEASIREVATQIGQASRLISEAAGDADGTNQAMEDLKNVVEKISEVTTLIQDIAEQTNLLALNATIEAARAGEAGRGFSVVASEVKSLAEQTAKATDQIGEQIRAIQRTTTSSIEGVEKISVRLQDLTTNASTVASTAEQQGAATGDIARSASDAAGSTNQVSESMSDIRDAAGEARRVSGEFRTAASRLSEQANDLSDRFDAFIARVRAA